MKKTFLFLLFALTFTCLSGQTERGRVMLNLSNFSPLIDESDLLAPTNSFGIAFGTIKEEDEEDVKYSVVGLEGSLHYFLFDNFSAGLNVGFLTDKITSKDDFTREEISVTQTLYMGGPELRYYFPLGARNKLFLRGAPDLEVCKLKSMILRPRLQLVNLAEV